MGFDLLGRPIVTAAELDRMTPQEVDEVWRASVVTDPSSLPADYVEKLRARAAADVVRREARAAS